MWYNWNLNHNPLTLRNFSHWQISSKLNRIIEVWKVVSSYQFNEKLDERERSSPRLPILFGLLFGWSAHPAGWQASDGYFPTRQNSFHLLNNWWEVMRCGKQFLRNERNKFLFKTGLLQSIPSGLFIRLWWVKTFLQMCTFIWLWKYIGFSCLFLWYFYIFLPLSYV